MNALFVITALVAIFSALMVITRRNAVHALLFLVVHFFSVAVLFYLAGAPFVAVMEIIIYAGAIVTLFVFVVMMLSLPSPSGRKERLWMKPSVWLVPLILVLVLLGELLIVIFSYPLPVTAAAFIGPSAVGYVLITEYMLAVELTAMLLMGGIIGAYHLGRRSKKPIHRYLEKEEEL